MLSLSREIKVLGAVSKPWVKAAPAVVQERGLGPAVQSPKSVLPTLLQEAGC